MEWTNGERPRSVKRVRQPEAARRRFKRRGFCRSRREMRPHSVHVRRYALFWPRAVRRPDLSRAQHEVRISNITRRDANKTRRLASTVILLYSETFLDTLAAIERDHDRFFMVGRRRNALAAAQEEVSHVHGEREWGKLESKRANLR